MVPVRSSLCARGFAWASSIGVWQRKLNDNASWAGKQVLRDDQLTNGGPPQPALLRQPGDENDEAPASLSAAQPANGDDDVPF